MELWIALAVMVVGLTVAMAAGTLGPPIVLLGALFYAYATDFMLLNAGTLLLMMALTLAGVWVARAARAVGSPGAGVLLQRAAGRGGAFLAALGVMLLFVASVF